MAHQSADPTPSARRPLVGRRTLLTGVGAGVAAAVTGCGGSGQSGGGKGGALAWGTWATAPIARTAFENMARTYESSHAGITISPSFVEYTQFTSALPAQLASSSPPDIFMVQPNTVFAKYVQRGLLADLSDVYQQSIRPTMAGNFRGFGAVDDKTYMVPHDWGWQAFFYNKELFRQHGYQVPTTWPSFVALCKQIKADGVTPLAVGTKSNADVNYFQGIVARSYGSDFYTQLASGKVSFTDPRVRTVFSRWTELVPYMTPNASAYTWQEQAQQVAQGKAAMQLIGPWILSTLGKTYVDRFGMFFFPTIDPAVRPAEPIVLTGFAVAARGKADAAKEFLAYLSTADAQNLYLKASGGIDSAVTNQKADGTLYTSLLANGVQHLFPRSTPLIGMTTLAPPDLSTELINAATELVQNPDRADALMTRLDQTRRQGT